MDRGGHLPPPGGGEGDLVDRGVNGLQAPLAAKEEELVEGGQDTPKTFTSMVKRRVHTPEPRNSLEVWIERDQDVRVTIDDQFMSEVIKNKSQ